MNILDKEGLCVYRLFREHCTQIKTSYVKDLKRLNREMKDLVILDNSPMSYALNHENGFPILSWFDDKQDRELYKITPILEFLSYVPDVRDFIPKMVINNEISIQRTMITMNSYNASLKSNCPQFNSMDKTYINNNSNDFIISYSGLPNTTMPVDNNNNARKNISSLNSSKNKKIFLSTNKHNASLTKEKPEINIKIINNNITNVIVNNETTTEPNLLFTAAVNKKRSHISVGENDKINNDESVKKISPKDVNTFRMNTNNNTHSLHGESNPISLSNLENLKMNKHKKVDSFTFGSGISKCSFLAGLKSKAMNLQNTNHHHNRQISLKGNNNNSNIANILTETGGSVVIDFKKLKHNDSNSNNNNISTTSNNQNNSYSRHGKTKSNQIIYNPQLTENKEMYRPSTSTRMYYKPPLQAQSQQLSSENYINRTASSRLLYDGNNNLNLNHQGNEIQSYQVTSYTHTEGKNTTTRPNTSSTKVQQYKITKKPIRPSQIKDLKIDGNELLIKKYRMHTNK